MKKLFLLFTILLFIAAPAHAKIKKVKIKEDKSILFKYETDSSVLKHKENKLMIGVAYRFYKAIIEDDYDTYVSLLSPRTIELIAEEKLKRKFGKFKMQAVNLMNTMNVRYIRKYTGDNMETSQIYIIVIKLPEGQRIPGRMGFDAMKRERFEHADLHTGLYMIRQEEDFKAVILF